MLTPNLPAVVRRRLPGLGLSVALAVGALLLLGRAVGGAAAAGNPAAPHQPAVTFVVTATADSDDNNLNDGQCHDQFNGGCSLRAAVQQLDHDAGGAITLPAGTFNLTNNGSGDLQLLKDITINGAGVTLIQGNPVTWTHRLLRVQNGAHVILNSLTISGGHLASGNGGGINVISGALTLNSITLRDSSAANGGGIYNSGRLTMTNVNLVGNQSTDSGGGLYNAITGTATLILTDVGGNSTANDGGGVANLGTLDIYISTVRYNTAGVLHGATGAGGGVANLTPGALTVEYSTISNNIIFGNSGGGLYNHILGGGKTTIVNSTVDGNQIKGNPFSLDRPQGVYNAVGAGIANIDGNIDLSSATVTSNTAEGFAGGGGIYVTSRATTTVRNTLVALNTITAGAGPDCNGILHSQGYNLVQSTASCAISGSLTGNITGLDPKLKPLGNYGGLIETRDLLPGSPAIDAGNPSGCRDSLGNLLSDDERGYPRVNGPFCDIGAVEGLSPLNRRLLLPLLEK